MTQVLDNKMSDIILKKAAHPGAIKRRNLTKKFIYEGARNLLINLSQDNLSKRQIPSLSP